MMLVAHQLLPADEVRKEGKPAAVPEAEIATTDEAWARYEGSRGQRERVAMRENATRSRSTTTANALSVVARVPLPYAREHSADRSRPRLRTQSAEAVAGVGRGMAVGELIAQLQRLWQRQRFRADEKAFARDIEKIIAQLGPRVVPSELVTASEDRKNGESDVASSSASQSAAVVPLLALKTKPTLRDSRSSQSNGSVTERKADVNVETLLDAMEALFRHRYDEVRTLAFEVINLCLTHYQGQLTGSVRHRIFQQLEEYDLGGDFEQRQKTLRLLTHDGRQVEPFNVELGWMLLQWLEESDEQRDLLSLIQNILRRSPASMDFETVIAITSIVCGRCDVAWSRGDVDTCRRFLSFFHVLATHRLEHALGTSVCLRTLCWMVNADGQGTWAVMKLLLNSNAGFQVLRGLVTILENPTQHSQWVLRGAVFFVGMSCWGSQRVAKLDQIKWAPILVALESCLECGNGVVIFEIILAIQRLVKKYGDGKTSAKESSETTRTSESRRLVVEWDIILRMFRALRPWLSANATGRKVTEASTTVLTSSSASTTFHKSAEVPVHLTRIPKELLDTLQVVVELVRENKFAGEIEGFYEVLEDYFLYLPETATRLLLRYHGEAAHPAHHVDWLQTLQSTMSTFFADKALPLSVREEALDLLQVNLWSSRNVCEDRVIEEVLLPMLSDIYDDPEPSIRRKGLDLIIEVSRTLESVRFDSLLDIVENAIVVSKFPDSQLCAVVGVVSLFSSYFNHLPQTRAIRMYEIIVTAVESHRNWEVRRAALECLLQVCEASSDYRLQWKDTITRTSRFLYCSRHVVRHHQTGGFVPVGNGLRAMLTRISTETHAHLFRMAVEGLRLMLRNRIILHDVDISDTAIKITSCVDYQAFGRAAIPDELKSALIEIENESQFNEGCERMTTIPTNNELERNAELLRSSPLSALCQAKPPTRVSSPSAKSRYQDAAVLLCKTRFATMGLQILDLFKSYINELNDSARHHLMVCLIGALDNQLVISDGDLIVQADADGRDTIRSESTWSWTSRPRTSSTSQPTRSITMCEPKAEQSSAQPSGSGVACYVEAKPTSPRFPFTSRVFSKLQSSAQSGLFTALTSTASNTGSDRRSTSSYQSATGVITRHERERLRKCLRMIYDAEFTLLHTACNAIGLLAHIIPDVVAARIDMVITSATSCFITPEGDFRRDGYSVVLEMVSNLVVGSHSVIMHLDHKLRLLKEVVLIAFLRRTGKVTVYIAYRVLCETIFRCHRREDRVALATGILPVLQDIVHQAPGADCSQIAEAAVDFLMSFAISSSELVPPPALCDKSKEPPDDERNGEIASLTRTWVLNNTIVSIGIRVNRPAEMIVRRPNSTSRWFLAMHHFSSVEGLLTSPETNLANEDRSHSQNACSTRTRHLSPPPKAVLHRDEITQRPPPVPPVLLPRPHTAHMPPRSVPAEIFMWRTRSKKHTKTTKCHKVGGPASDSSINVPVPPLPAYDGVGGSPSFFREPAPDDSLHEPMEVLHLAYPNNTPNGESAPEESTCTNANGLHDAPGEKNVIPCTMLPPTSREELPIEHANSPSTTEESEEVTGASPLSTDDLPAHVDKDPRFGRTIPSDLDPLFLMMQLYDLNSPNRPRLLANGDSLLLGLSVLDRTPEFETHKIGVLYLRSDKQKREIDILDGFGGSVKYLQFLRSLGTLTRLQGFQGYAGGMDTSGADSDGKYMLLYRSYALQMVFHVATMMTPFVELKDRDSVAGSSNIMDDDRIKMMKKKRHIGNDFVHVVFKECDDEYDVQTFSGQFNDVHIIVQPLNDHEYRTQVKCKPGIPPFGPLYGTQIVPSSVVAECVRLTCLNANLACQAFHHELIGFTMNCEERLKQIKQLGARHSTQSNEWMLSEASPIGTSA